MPKGYIINKQTGLRESYFDLPFVPGETATHSFYLFERDAEDNAIIPELEKPAKTKAEEEAEVAADLKKIDDEYGPRYIREYFIANNLITDLTAKNKIVAAESQAGTLRSNLATIKAK